MVPKFYKMAESSRADSFNRTYASALFKHGTSYTESNARERNYTFGTFIKEIRWQTQAGR